LKLERRSEARVSDVDWNRWAQGLSDHPAPDPSLFFCLEPGTNRTLDLIFSHTYIPPGKFNLKRQSKGSPNWRLYLNCAGNDYYQRGIPGISASLDQTAAWLARVIAKLDVSFIRAIGVSMGGYAALLFGQLLSVDHIISVGPEIVIGEPHDRSFIWYEEKIYDPRYRDLSGILKDIGARGIIVFAAYDVADFVHIARAQAADCLNVIYLHAFHTGGQWLDWPKILATERDVAFPQGLTAHPLFDFSYGRDALAEGAACFAAICTRRFAAAYAHLASLRSAKSNPGFAAQMAAQLCLMGDGEAARAQLAAAKAEHQSFYEGTGIAPPDAFPARLVMGAYRHVLTLEEQGALRQLLDHRSDGPQP
jgi:pimeloyl-ACP methyl ester carboxylesterase